MAEKTISLISRVRNWWNFAPSPSDQTTVDLYQPLHRNPDPKRLESYISPVQLQRIRQDVLSWRQGIGEAENAWYPQRVQMNRLYIDTVLNGHVQACIEKRRNLTLLRKFRLVNASGEPNKEATKLLQKQWFYDFLSYVVDAKFYGYSLIQLGDIAGGEMTGVSMVRRWNVSPDRLNVTTYVYSISGVPFLKPPFSEWCVWVPTTSDVGSSSCGFGLLYKVGVYEIMLRNLLGFNGDFVEVYGQPFRWGKTSKTQEDPERALFEEVLRQMGSNAYAVTDPSDEIEFLEAKLSTGTNNPYENLEKRCEAKISKVLLGHADAIDSVPGKLGNDGEESPAQVALSDIQITDGRFVESVVNGSLLPKLQVLGLPFPQNLRFEFDNDDEMIQARVDEDTNNKATAEVILSLSQAGFEVDPAYITDRTGIPVTKKAEPLPTDAGFSPEITNRLRKLYGSTH